jgi:hypothetical protein
MYAKSWAAVSIVANSKCCDEARRNSGVRHLAASAPALPLPECTMPGQCHCHYQKHADRRSDEDRRELNHNSIGHSFHGGTKNRRGPTEGRRSTDR